MTAKFQRILIVLFGAIGDVTRALPLLCRLRRGYPEAHIAWAVEPLAAPLVDGHPALDECLLFDRRRGIPEYVAFLGRVRARRFDLVLDLGRGLKSGLTALVSGAPARLGFDRAHGREGNWCFQTRTISPPADISSKLRQFLCFADALGVPEVPVRFDLAPTGPERGRAGELLAGTLRPFAVFVVGSSCPSRRWFPDRTAAVARALWKERGYPAVLIGTASDRAFAAGVRAAAGSPITDVVGQTTLREALGILTEAAVVVSPDSGAMHLAAAVGTPVVSLWGATRAERSAPQGSEHLTVVGEAGCAPCYLKDCPIGRVCMETVRVDSVVAQVSAALQEPERVEA